MLCWKCAQAHCNASAKLDSSAMPYFLSNLPPCYGVFSTIGTARYGWGGYEMKTCWSIRRILGTYQDGVLGHQRAQRVARHLHTCPACQRELLDLRRVTLVLQSLPGPSRPPEYWPWALLQLQQKLQHRPREPVRSSWLDYLRCSPEAPAQALVPVALVGMALFGTVTFLGLEDEAFVFFTSYLLPIVLQ
jgi:hypothetical protein